MTRKNTGIKSVADLKGRSVAVTPGTDPHIFLVRKALDELIDTRFNAALTN